MPSSDLATLCALIAQVVLMPHIHVEADWMHGGQMARDLLSRKVTGKVVLKVGTH